MSEQEIPSEGSNPQQIPPQERFTKSPLARRSLFKGAAVLAGAAALSKGFVPQALIAGAEYLHDSSPVRIFFGNHHISPQSDQVAEAFYNTGDLRLCQWDDSTVSMIDRPMKEARQQGRPYFMMVDSSSASVTQNLVLGGAGEDQNSASFKAEEFTDVPPDWLFLPHPNLLKKELYPEDIYLVEGDLRRDFGFGDVPNSEDYLIYIQDLAQTLNDRYFQKSRPEIVAEAEHETVKAVRDKLTEGAIVAAALAAGLPMTETTKGRIFKVAGLLASVGAIEAGKGILQGNALSLLIGEQSDPIDQKILTSLSDTVDWTYADKPTILWANARTALAIEKAQEIARSPSHSISQQPVQIDLLYGSAHSAELTRIMSNQSYRHQLIAGFMSDILRQIDIYIDGYKGLKASPIQITVAGSDGIESTENVTPPDAYTQLKSIRNDLFRAAANSMLTYKISEMNMPWGKEKVSPDEIATFEKNLTTEKVAGQTQSLKPVVRDVLLGFGIKD